MTVNTKVITLNKILVANLKVLMAHPLGTTDLKSCFSLV